MTTQTEHHHSKQHPRVPQLPRVAAMRLAATEYERVAAQFERLTPEQWSSPTECPDWDVRAMAGHMLGMVQMVASMPEMIRQQLAAKRRAKREGCAMIDALTALQVDKNASLRTDELAQQVRRLAPKAVKARRSAPALMRRQTMPDGDEWWTIGYLFDVISDPRPFPAPRRHHARYWDPDDGRRRARRSDRRRRRRRVGSTARSGLRPGADRTSRRALATRPGPAHHHGCPRVSAVHSVVEHRPRDCCAPKCHSEPLGHTDDLIGVDGPVPARSRTRMRWGVDPGQQRAGLQQPRCAHPFHRCVTAPPGLARTAAREGWVSGKACGDVSARPHQRRAARGPARADPTGWGLSRAV